MEPAEEKFKRSQQRFRRTLERERTKGRRTIFLDDEVPSTSRRQRCRTRGSRGSPRAQHPARAPRPAPSNPPKGSARLFGITVHETKEDCPPPPLFNELMLSDTDDECPPPPAGDETCPPAPLLDKPISSDSDDECPPPPPVADEMCPPPPVLGEPVPEVIILVSDGDEVADDDLDLRLPTYLLDDELLEEFRRTFFGQDETSLVRRPPSPPSPARTPSSIDWENENFRPPTPPRRQVLSSFATQDRQFLHLGMRCYERTWRARLLVRDTKPTPGIGYPSSNHKFSQEKGEIAPNHCQSPTKLDELPNHGLPRTPGRGWILEENQMWLVSEKARPPLPEAYTPEYQERNTQSRVQSRDASPTSSPMSPSTVTDVIPSDTSPLSSNTSSLEAKSNMAPPAVPAPTQVIDWLQAIIPPRATEPPSPQASALPPSPSMPYMADDDRSGANQTDEIPLHLAPEQLRVEVQEVLRGTRGRPWVRFVRNVDGHRYRVMVSRAGIVRIIRLRL